MAKIFETPKDVERDRLNQVVRNERSEARASFLTGFLLAMFSIDPILDRKTVSSRWDILDKTFGWALAALSVISLGLAAAAHNKKKKTEQELQKLGPEEVVYLSDPSSREGNHVARLQNTSPSEPTRSF